MSASGSGPLFGKLGACGLVSAALLAGCAAPADYTARFLRYEQRADGTRLAVVSPVQHGAETEEQDAYTDIEDLKAGDIVYVHASGRDWDEPQTSPECTIVGRARDKE